MKKILFIFSLLFLSNYGFAIETNPSRCLGKSSDFDRFYVHHAPDPVNARTGNFYFPVQDLHLPCFGLSLEVFRAYNSFSKANGLLGVGWTFNYDLKISIGDVATLKVIEADGFINTYKSESLLNVQKGQVIDKIIQAKKTEDMQYSKRLKSEEYYDKMRIRLATDTSYYQRLKSRYVKSPKRKVELGKYVSTARGKTTIIKKKDGYIRIKQNNIKEFYNKKGYLTRIEDVNGNFLNFSINKKGKLKRVSDGCRHFLLITYNKRGKIIKITDSLGRAIQYTYNESDLLTSATTLSGKTIKYAYNQYRDMTELTTEGGQLVTIKYGKKKRRVTEQKGPGKKVTKYKYAQKGKNYKRAVISDNRGTYEKLEFYKNELKTVQTDKKGNQVITVLSKTCSKPISVTNKKGKGSKYTYNDKGNLTEKIDQNGNVVKYEHHPQFDIPTKITDQEGNRLTFLYDTRGNLTYANFKNHGWVKIRYEKHGKYQSLSDNKGNIINYTYNYFGKPIRIEKKVKNKTTGAIITKYAPTGEIRNIKYEPNNAKIIEDIKVTLRNIFELIKPSGINFQI